MPKRAQEEERFEIQISERAQINSRRDPETPSSGWHRDVTRRHRRRSHSPLCRRGDEDQNITANPSRKEGFFFVIIIQSFKLFEKEAEMSERSGGIPKSLSEEAYEALKRLAEQRGMTIEDVVREALKFEEEYRKRLREPDQPEQD